MRDQQTYARLLTAGTYAGLGILVCFFLAYVLGWLPPLVPH